METLYTIIAWFVIISFTIQGGLGLRLVIDFLQASKKDSKKKPVITFKQLFERMGIYQSICTIVMIILLIAFILWIIYMVYDYTQYVSPNIPPPDLILDE